MALINTAAPIWSSEINQLGLQAGDVFDAYARAQLKGLPPLGRGYFNVEEMYAVPELAKTPKPRANRKLLLCQS